MTHDNVRFLMQFNVPDYRPLPCQVFFCEVTHEPRRFGRFGDFGYFLRNSNITQYIHITDT